MIAENSRAVQLDKEEPRRVYEEVLFYTQIAENHYDNYPARQNAQEPSTRFTPKSDTRKKPGSCTSVTRAATGRLP